MKLLSTAIAAAALITAADAKGFNGFYVGMDLGVSADSTKISKARPASAAVQMNRSANGSANRTNLGLLLGYNKLLSSCFTLGGLFTSDFNFNSKKTFHTSEEYKFANKKGTYSWGVYATAGALINQKTAAFVGLGVKSLKFKTLYTEFDANGGSASFKNKSVRFSVLTGVESLFANDSMALRLTYGITPGKNKTAIVTDPNNLFAANGDRVTFKSRMTEQQVKVGVTYRF